MKKEDKILLIGCGVSLVIIVALFIIRAYKEDWLDINVQWIGVAVLPMVLALIVGKFIKKFTGFGVELEIVSEKALSTSTDIIEALHVLYSADKSSLNTLAEMSENEKVQINVLRFQAGKMGYYDNYTVLEYLRRLPNLKFFEIVEPSGKFKSLKRVNAPEIIRREQTEKIQAFINGVEINRFEDAINTTSNYIDLTTSAIDTLKELRKSGKNFIAVLDKKRSLRGVVFKSKLEGYLSTVLINATEKNN